MKTLTLTHRFASGRVVTLTVERTGALPNITSSLRWADMEPEEQLEYLAWRDTAVRNTLASILNEKELEACAEHARRIAGQL